MGRIIARPCRKDTTRDECMLIGGLAMNGYDWWWHSFTGKNVKTGEEKGFFVEFFLCNPGLGGDKPVFGQLPENKKRGIKPSYLMVKAGAWGKNAKQIHRFFGWNDVKIRRYTPFAVKAGDCLCSETRLKGHVCVTPSETEEHPEYMCDAGEMYFDLKVDKKIAYNVGYGAGWMLRTLQAFEMYWHAEGMKTEYSGKVILDGEEYEISPKTSYGYADKNWGSDFTSPWVWLSSNNLRSEITGRKLEKSVFDIGGGKPKVFGIALNRQLLGVMNYEGEEFEYNFSKPFLFTKTQFNCEETSSEIIWNVIQENYYSVMITKIRCKKEDMLLVNYESPKGEKKHNRLFNGGNGEGIVELYKKTRIGLRLIDRIRAKNVGCEYGEFGGD